MPSCLNLETLNIQFTLRVIGEVDEYPDYIKQVNYVPITMKTTETLSDKNNHVKLYKIENLLPGRRYELQVSMCCETIISFSVPQFAHIYYILHIANAFRYVQLTERTSWILLLATIHLCLLVASSYR